MKPRYTRATRSVLIAALALLTAAVAICHAAASPTAAEAADYASSVKAEKILTTTTDGNGQPLRYLTTGKPEVTAMTVEIPPGGETGWHLHTMPVYAYVLAGRLEVELADGKVLAFKQGDAIVEVQNLAHNGRNKGTEPVKLAVFYTGEAGMPLAIKTDSPVPRKPSKLTVGTGFKEPVTGMAFVTIPGGCYKMGDSFGHGLEGELPVHEVCVDDFALGKNLVTVGQFRAFVKATGYKTDAESGAGCGIWHFDERPRSYVEKDKNWRNPGFRQDDRHPVVCVTWNDAAAYAAWLARTSGVAYRLPTEAEYEYAARGGGKPYEYAWGSGPVAANVYDESAMKRFTITDKPESALYRGYDDGYPYTAPVGSYKPNELGLNDMAGNVCAWLADWYGETFYTDSPRDNPKGPATGDQRMLRGSTWADDKRQTRTTTRIWYIPTLNSNDTGMRLAGPAAIPSP